MTSQAAKDLNDRAAPGAKGAPAGAQPLGCTNFKLRQLMRRVAQHYDSTLAPSGLKTTQYSLLSHVLKLGPLPPGVLARAMTMDASTLTRNLQPLVRAGWLVLEAGADGRSRQVRLTPAGEAKRAEARGLWLAAQQALNARLELGRVAALHALIDDSLRLLAPGAGTGASVATSFTPFSNPAQAAHTDD